MSNEGASSEPDAFQPKVNIDVAQERGKPRLLAILFCEYAGIAQDTKHFFVGSFERFTFGPIEAKITTSFFLFVRTSETRDGRLQIAVIDPKGKVIMAMAFLVQPEGFTDDTPATVQFLDRIQFAVPIEGVYWFDVSYKGESLGGAPLVIEFLKQEESKDEQQAGNA